MTIAEFKAGIVGFINRDASLFTVGGVDQILLAMNAARRMAQRVFAFEMLHKDVFLVTSAAGAEWTTACTLTPGGTALVMRRVDEVWQYTTGTVGATTIYPRTLKISLGSFQDFKRELPEYYSINETAASGVLPSTRVFAYRVGTKLYINNVTTATSYLINGIYWLPDLGPSDTADTLFIDYFADWFFWATIMQLNQFLRNDQRVGVDSSFVKGLWDSVREFDGQAANSGDSVTLD